MSSRVFHSGALHLKLDAAVVEALTRFAQREAVDLEAGGVLIGRRIEGTPHSVVDEVTHPLSGDRRARAAFARRDHRHQERVDAAWKDSGGTSGYLGEWHTHPEPDPTPSNIDRRDWRRRLSHDDVDADYIYFVIVGTKRIAAWLGDRRTGVVQPMARDGSLLPNERSREG